MRSEDQYRLEGRRAAVAKQCALETAPEGSPNAFLLGARGIGKIAKKCNGEGMGFIL